MLFILFLRAKDYPSDGRVKAIRTDDQIKTPLFSAFKRDTRSVFLLINCPNGIAAQNFAIIDYLSEYQPRKVAPSYRHEWPGAKLIEYLGAKTGNALAVPVNNAKLSNVISLSEKPGQKAHFLSDVVS